MAARGAAVANRKAGREKTDNHIDETLRRKAEPHKRLSARSLGRRFGIMSNAHSRDTVCHASPSFRSHCERESLSLSGERVRRGSHRPAMIARWRAIIAIYPRRPWCGPRHQHGGVCAPGGQYDWPTSDPNHQRQGRRGHPYRLVRALSDGTSTRSAARATENDSGVQSTRSPSIFTGRRGSVATCTCRVRQ